MCTNIYREDCKSEVQISMSEMPTVKSEFRSLRSKVWRYLSAYVWRPRPTSFDNYIRDRPFNLKGGLWFFVSFRIFFSDNSRFRIFIFFVAQSANFFFQNSTLGYRYMTKILNHIYFFFLHQNQNIFFQQHWESEYFFRKKTITHNEIV